MKFNILFKKTRFILSFFLFIFSLSIYAQQKNLIVIDNDYPNKESLIASVPKSEVIIQISLADNLWSNIYSLLVVDTEINNIHLFLKTTKNKFKIGNVEIGVEELKNNLDIQKLGTIEASDKEKSLFVYSCSLANNSEGIKLLETVSIKTKFNVISAKGCLSIFDSNFDFNYSSKDLLTNTDLILD